MLASGHEAQILLGGEVVIAFHENFANVGGQVIAGKLDIVGEDEEDGINKLPADKIDGSMIIVERKSDVSFHRQGIVSAPHMQRNGDGSRINQFEQPLIVPGGRLSQAQLLAELRSDSLSVLVGLPESRDVEGS